MSTRSSVRLGDLRIEGGSRAGHGTWFRIHPPGIGFDSGRGAAALAGASTIFLTHGHLDHALGLPFVLSQRSLYGAEETTICCPAPLKEDLELFLTSAERLERASYRYHVVSLEPRDRRRVSRNLVVEAFAVDHGVPALGYHLLREKRKLLQRYRDSDRSEIVAARKSGRTVEESVETVWVSYPGDTSAAVFAMEPRVFEAEVLLLECTFLGPESRDRAVRYKHLHFEDLVDVKGKFRNRAIVLHHLSRKYSQQALAEAVKDRLSDLDGRVHLLS